MISGKKVVIVGAGIAGLSCAVALQKKSLENGIEPPTVILLERDNSPESKDRQNYTISLRSEVGGYQALEELEVLEELKGSASLTRGFYVATHDSKSWSRALFIDSTAKKTKGIRAPRFKVWKTLLDKALSYGNVSIRWSTVASNVFLLDPSDGSVVDHEDLAHVNRVKDVECKLRIKLQDGSTIEDADVVIVADGCRSQVRDAIFGDAEKVNFLNTVGIIGEAKFENEKVPDIVKEAFGLLVSKGCSVFTTHEKRDTIIWAISFNASTPRHASDILVDGIDETIGAVLCREALEVGKDIPQPFETLVRNSLPDKMRLISFFDKFPHRSILDGRVIFIGDSTHPVSPYSGSGANMAIVDGLSLARSLCSPSFTSLASAVRFFDDDMVNRSSKAVRMQRKKINMANGCLTPFKIFTRNTFLHTTGFISRNYNTIIAASFAVVVSLVACGAYYFNNLK
eukprot:CAMPEP_0117029554 /NCGR_PEP_ID=MMETSP0472-20121206/21391_1 /TAXON_ID=693140 ORGANISM="Tiarina fusus, Strain LIS" /NCGR_SAMPLE_ID=MMETSP0472 /ASSEMBLY_ACC=CAM_ASM_000603 /LENGTH=455 /DNA_ID=CAMNT_0004737353 /DNA_START=19 /DNA_END=1386 /DNA_ORIENTATION=-